MLAESAFTVETVAVRIKTLLDSPDRLAEAAAQQRQAGRPDAARRLAELVEAAANPDTNGAGGTADQPPREAAA